MALDDAQPTALRLVLKACADECARSALGNLLEGHLKVVGADALLHAGYSILESANVKGQGRVVSLCGGRLQQSLDSRPTMAAFSDSGKAKMSPDLRVWSPCRLIVELQVRSSFGAQSALFSANLLDDIRRVGTRTVDAFVLAADRSIYDALRGVKEDRRGRKALHADVLRMLLPASETLAQVEDPASWPSVITADHFDVCGVVQPTSFGADRCIVGVWTAA